MLVAFILLVSAKMLLWLAVPYLPEFVTWLGLAIMLTASTLLMMVGLLTVIRHIMLNIRSYCSASQRQQRRLLFMQSRQDQVCQHFDFKTAQISYFHNLKRKKLLAADNRRQIQALSKAIEQELLTAEKQLSKNVFKELQHQHSVYRHRQDSEALLQLQQKIATLSDIDQ